jgi:hypothetical protein
LTRRQAAGPVSRQLARHSSSEEQRREEMWKIMRSKLIILVMFFAFVVSGMEQSMLISAKTTDDIKGWSKWPSKFHSFEASKHKFAILITGVGSGMYVERAYIFQYAGSEWKLVCFRLFPSSADPVTVTTQNNAIIFRNKSKKALFQQSFEELAVYD